MSKFAFIPQPPFTDNGDPGVFVEGIHTPTQLVERSGIWLSTAGSAMLLQENYTLSKSELPLWLLVDEGTATFISRDSTIQMEAGDCVAVPPETDGCSLTDAKDARLLWITFKGPLCEPFLRQMNAWNTFAARQGVLPGMINLIRQIVQVLVRHTETGDSSYQLQQLLWGLLAAHSGQSVSNNAILSHEIARVVDTLRASRYHESFSLADMAAISRVPVETFRKRFTTELGIPPLAYLQFQKMERAKSLLREGISVRSAGVEIGMPDPYHFSKQFKRVVGMSPTAYLKHVGKSDPQLYLEGEDY